MKKVVFALALSLTTVSFASQATDTSNGTAKSASQEESVKQESAEQGQIPPQTIQNWIGDGWCHSDTWGLNEDECFIF